MSLARYNGVVQDDDGNGVSSAKIEVRREVGGQPLAALYSDRDGLVSIGNPFDAGADGSFYFHAAGGAHQVRAYTGASGSPTFEKILRYEALGLAAEADLIDLSSGVFGNLPVTNLDDGTNASSQRFWRGDGTWAIPAGSALYDTVAAVAAATIPGTVNQILTAGYSSSGDGGGSIATNAIYKRASAPGSPAPHAGYITSVDGAYWELIGPLVSVKQFGAVAAVSNIDTDPSSATAINLCMAYCNLKTVNMLIPSGVWPLDAAVTSPTFIIEIIGNQGGGQPTILYKRYVEADANKGIISFGAWGATIRDIQFAAKSGASGGSGLSAILPNNAANIGILRLNNIYVSCGDGVNASLHINGVANIGGPASPPTGGKSYRSVFLENCHFFGAAQYTVLLLSVQHCFGSNIYTDTTGGTTSSGYAMNCAGTANAPNDDIFWTGIIAGSASLDRLTRAVFNSVVSGNIDNTANVDGVTVDRCSGTIQQAWTNSGVVNSGAWATSSPTPTSTGGTLTSASSTVAYKKLGKIVHCEGSVTVTTIGSGTGSLNLQLPFTLVRAITFAGKENSSNGLVYVAGVSTAGVLGILKADNTTHLVGTPPLVFPFCFTAELA